MEKDLSNIKDKQATEEGIKDFFKIRDVSNKVEDTNKILSEEITTKEELYKKSLKIETLPSHIKPLFNNILTTLILTFTTSPTKP